MKNLKRMLLTAITAAAACASLILPVGAVQSVTGTVNVSGYLNVRQYSNTGAPIVGKLYNGAKVTITGSTNGWDKIVYNGATAWVAGRYVSDGGARAAVVVNAAKSALGVRYVFGGASLSGFDCSGLALYAYNEIGVTLPHSAAQQASQGIAVARSNLQPGDLIFFDTSGGGNITHVGIYIGGGSFISAQSGAGVVKQASLSNTYWSGAYLSARRLLY